MLQDFRPNVNLALDFHFYRYDLLDAYSKPLKHRNTYNRSRRIGATHYTRTHKISKKKKGQINKYKSLGKVLQSSVIV